MNTNKRFLPKIVLSVVLTPLITLLIGEAFTHLFNVLLDAPLSSRVIFTFQKPLIFALVLVMQSIMLLFIMQALRPLRLYLKKPDPENQLLYAKARRAALNLPWILIIVTTSFWTLGTIAFYALNNWQSPGGTPLGWVLAFKISEGLLSATLNALIINRVLIGAKQELHMDHVRPGENDWFNKTRDVINVLATMAASIAHLAYVARYFMNRNQLFQGPTSPMWSLLLTGTAIGTVSLIMVLLSRDEDRTQTNLLRDRIAQLTSREATDLTAKATIINFNAIGDLADGFNRYTESLCGMVEEINQSMSSLELTTGRLSAGSGSLQLAVDEIASAVNGIGQVVIQEVSSVESASASISQISHNIDDLDNIINEQAAMVTQSSAGIEELISNIQSVSSNVDQVQSYYTKLQESASTGRRKINEANGLISKVAQMSSLLADANKVIAAIAAQTNLLAMNAAIEAAHAGSAGAGFSVVADEIRGLAEKSAVQSKDVGHHLREVKNSIDQAVTASAAAELGFSEVNTLIDTVSRYEDEIRNALREQTIGSQQVLEALTAMNRVSETVKSEASEMASGTRSIVDNMRQLNELSTRIKNEMSVINRDIGHMTGIFSDILGLVNANASDIQQVRQQLERFQIAKS